ncbi:MAG: hypothetical protein KKI06_12205 [Euryarchaeota archaeon]|nr:hypothetical protein [Euryarchaeota archaeon]
MLLLIFNNLWNSSNTTIIRLSCDSTKSFVKISSHDGAPMKLIPRLSCNFLETSSLASRSFNSGTRK